METIANSKLWSFTREGDCRVRTCEEVRQKRSCRVQDYFDLAKKIAELQFRNPNYVLLFRGQKADYKRNTNSSGSVSALVPSLLRGVDSVRPEAGMLIGEFERLKLAELYLVQEFETRRLGNVDQLRRQRILRWSILQHYEVCKTPLLDVTHSLRLAASFASDGAQNKAYVFVLGVPNLSGAVTASAEAGLQIVRLSSVCPPTAIRPHIQEGYLLGEYPELADFDQKQNYAHYEVDFGRRLVAKFRFDPSSFWKDPAFPRINREALYPDSSDPFVEVAERVKSLLPGAQ